MNGKVLTWGLLAAPVLLVAAFLLNFFLKQGDLPLIIPLPNKISTHNSHFYLRPTTRIVSEEKLRPSAEFLVNRLAASTKFPLKVEVVGSATRTKGAIVFTASNAAGEPEGYTLDVEPKTVVINSGSTGGAFYAVQSLLQLMSPEVFRTAASAGPEGWTIQSASISDSPRFQWRGFLLDVARHFFTLEEVERFADNLALHKLNRFQLHLTDDQGWRIEIKKHPRLTEIGAWRKDIAFKLDPKSSTAYGPDGRYGGFYTQDQVRALVRYASERNITMVPEIEVPGHASAALSAYPELSCSGGPYSTDLDAGVFAGVFCAGNDDTFKFLEDVFTEVMELFPGKYIHIGGDEVPKENWKKCPKCQARMKAEGLKNEEELQSYFVRRIEKFITSRGRTLVGWSEISEGGLAPNSIVMDWIGGAVEAASQGHDVVMSPTTFAYLDYYQSTNRAAEPRAIGGFVPLQKVYSFEPIPEKLPPELRRHILGCQGNLWTEYIANLAHAEYMAFPRLCALAEVGWTSPGNKNYQDFTKRLQVHLRRLDARGTKYRALDDSGKK